MSHHLDHTARRRSAAAWQADYATLDYRCRTALTAVVGFVNLLETSAPLEQASLVRRIRYNTRSLQTCLDEMATLIIDAPLLPDPSES